MKETPKLTKKRHFSKKKKKRVHHIYLCCLRKIVTSKFAFQTEFMHDPIALLTLWSSPFIEHEGLLHPHKVPFPFVNLLIFSCGLPVPRFCCSIGSHPSWVLPILLTEEVPLFLPYLGFLCTTHINSTKSIFHSNLKNNHQITNQQLKLIIRRYKVDPVIEKR